MILDFIGKLLSLIGLHPDRFEERFQINLRRLVQVFLFFNILPQLNNVVWKVMNEPRVGSYSVDILYFVYNLVINLQFLSFVIKFEDISNLLNFIRESLKGDGEAYAAKQEKWFIVFCKVAFGMATASYVVSTIDVIFSDHAQFLDYNRYPFDTSFPPLYIALYTCGFISLVLNDIFHLGILICYFNICIHFDSLYHQLYVKMSAIEHADSEEAERSIVKSFVEYHINIMDNVARLFHSFHSVLALEFFSLTFTMSFTFLLFATDGNVTETLTYIPIILFGLFQFCFPSELVGNQVNL